MKSFTSLLLLIIFGIALASSVIMAEMHSTPRSDCGHTAMHMSCQQPQTGSLCLSICISVHVGVFQKLIALVPSFESALLAHAVLALMCIAATALFAIQRQRLRLLAAALSIRGLLRDIFGIWLSLFEKRDPVLTFAIA